MAWAPDYVTEDELAAFVEVEDVRDDVPMGLAIAAASRAIDRTTRRQFGRVDAPEARFYTARWDDLRARWVVPIDDLMDDAGLEIAFDEDEDETYGAPITVHALRPVNAAQKGRPWEDLVVPPRSAVQPTTLDAGVKVTARWGWTEVPTAVKEACLLQASRVLKRRHAPFGVAGSPEAGSEVRLLAKVDPDVEVALAGYKRGAGRGGAVFA
ncbi:hypothetical protein [Pseudonocardia sp. NPDC049154]|uniref:hypothetical protein n=1 Tax=Pseudonocardia sp. NPDC049154 TaxID=3155501 RepID=UPI003403249C